MVDFEEKRKFDRLPIGTDVFFKLIFDIKTQVNFQVIDKDLNKALSRKYLALSKNVSVEGLCFSCLKKLEEGDMLLLEVVSPVLKKSIPMKGQVRWSRKITPPEFDDNKFDTGIRILEINGRSMDDTLVQDEEKKIIWSGLLESMLGSYDSNKG